MFNNKMNKLYNNNNKPKKIKYKQYMIKVVQIYQIKPQLKIFLRKDKLCINIIMKKNQGLNLININK